MKCLQILRKLSGPSQEFQARRGGKVAKGHDFRTASKHEVNGNSRFRTTSKRTTFSCANADWLKIGTSPGVLRKSWENLQNLVRAFFGENGDVRRVDIIIGLEMEFYILKFDGIWEQCTRIIMNFQWIQTSWNSQIPSFLHLAKQNNSTKSASANRFPLLSELYIWRFKIRWQFEILPLPNTRRPSLEFGGRVETRRPHRQIWKRQTIIRLAGRILQTHFKTNS